jgi:hypothetical protein
MGLHRLVTRVAWTSRLRGKKMQVRVSNRRVAHDAPRLPLDHRVRGGTSTMHDSNDAHDTVISRREAIIGALALAAGSLIAKPEIARAATDVPVYVGQDNPATAGTVIARMSDTAFLSLTGLGMNDGTRSYAVDGETLNGGAGSAGAYGHTAVAGHVGVLARHSGGGTALEVDGRVHFSRSGSSTFSKGGSYRTVTVSSGVSTTDLILVTMQGSAGTGVYVRYAKRYSATSFRVYLNKAATTSTATFAWLILG